MASEQTKQHNGIYDTDQEPVSRKNELAQRVSKLEQSINELTSIIGRLGDEECVCKVKLKTPYIELASPIEGEAIGGKFKPIWEEEPKCLGPCTTRTKYRWTTKDLVGKVNLGDADQPVCQVSIAETGKEGNLVLVRFELCLVVTVECWRFQGHAGRFQVRRMDSRCSDPPEGSDEKRCATFEFS